ncbi:MAG: ABC transporter permease [Tissierellia bacterium]|nr:ABC transporter permease [Tissierellia bacterium]MDD4726853.1 ABC transporter permease [Tissierellia bacterium]
MDIFIGILEQGMIYAILALGIYITYKILNFPDLTVDGSFPLGAAVTAYLMTNSGDFVSVITLSHNPYIICVYALIAGSIAGLVTGIIHVKFNIRDLISGIITMTGLYSINLRIAGSANVPIFNYDTIFSNSLMGSIFPESLLKYKVIIIATIITLGTKIILDLYLKTKSGFLLRAVGNNQVLVTTLAKDSGNVKILGLVIGNAIVSLSGSILMQQQGFFEITMGTGTMVLGLASVIIGTNVFKKAKFMKATTSVIFGSIIYKAAMSAAMDISFTKASDMKLVTAILFLVILVFSEGKKKKVKADA